MLADSGVRMDRLIKKVSRDPIFTLLVLKEANGVRNVSSGGKSLSVKEAVVSLGLENLRAVVDRASEQDNDLTDEQELWLRIARQKCRRASVVAGIIAKVVERKVQQEAFTVCLLAYCGDLLAITRVPEPYIEIAKKGARRSQCQYRLKQHHQFDMEGAARVLLKQSALPTMVNEALDPESSNLSPETRILKNICQSAIEFVDAFVEDRLDRLAPDVPIPPKSFRRTLQLSDEQYEKLFEEVQHYLVEGKLLKDGTRAVAVEVDGSEDEILGEQELELRGIKSEIEAELTEQESVDVENDEDSEKGTSTEDRSQAVREKLGSEQSLSEEEILENLSCYEDDEAPQPVKSAPTRVAPPGKRAPRVQKNERLLTQFIDVFADLERVEDLLQQMLDMLVAEGPFNRAALMVVVADEKKAYAAMSRGDIEGSEEVSIEDPLSPFANMRGRVLSFSRRSNAVSPFGCQSFALAPIDLKGNRPVALYVDCGDEKVLTFESRRLFRKVVDIVNNLLPGMEGEMPEELR